jgi:hypothetical protein
MLVLKGCLVSLHWLQGWVVQQASLLLLASQVAVSPKLAVWQQQQRVLWRLLLQVLLLLLVWVLVLALLLLLQVVVVVLVSALLLLLLVLRLLLVMVVLVLTLALLLLVVLAVLVLALVSVLPQLQGWVVQQVSLLLLELKAAARLKLAVW